MSNGDKQYNVLFVCTGNAARSQMGEALLSHVGKGRFKAYSAGVNPRPDLFPETREVLRLAGIGADGLAPKPVSRFTAADAPVMDFVFVVCERAQTGSPLVFPGHPMRAYWPITDPAAFEGIDPVEFMAVFQSAFREMKRRVEIFAELPISALDKLSLQGRLDRIGTQAQAVPERQPA